MRKPRNFFLPTLLLTLTAVLFISIPASSEPVTLPVVELLGKNYYVYKVKKGDSLFGIARANGWDDNLLKELNPSAVAPLKKGMLIYYPVAEQTQKTETPKAKVPSEVDELRHEVKRGETVYAIATMYNVPVERIYSLNPSSKNGIKAGETLLIRKKENTESAANEKKSIFYTVKNGDTLYALARTYGVTVASIMESNPGVNEENFRAGSKIKIPKRGTGVTVTSETITKQAIDSVKLRKVEKGDTWKSIAQEHGVSVDVLKEANPETPKLKNNNYIGVPQVDTLTMTREVVQEDPRELTRTGLNEIYEDVHGITAAEDGDEVTVRIAVVVDNASSKKNVEFLRGFLVGLDKQKHADYKVQFKVVNEKEGTTSVIEQLDVFKPTLVFATSEDNLPAYLCEYASVSHTPVVNTFDVKSEAYTENPYIVQMLAPSSMFNDNIAHYINSKYGERTIIFAGDADDSDQLAESLRKIWDSSKIRNASLEEIEVGHFAPEGKYLVYGNGVKKSEVSSLLEKVAAVREQRPLADVSMIGRPNLIMFEESMNRELQKADASIPSRFYIDKESSEYREFVQRYKLMFNRMPSKSLPLYAAVGYDTSTFFIPALAESRGDINKLPSSRNTVQSDFELWRTSNWSGFLNPPVYLVEFTPFGMVNKNKVSYGE